jgi:transcription termination factor Rho
MDEVIFEEFKGTGNNEIILDRKLADRRIFPAINIKKSGTRRDDLLLPADEAARVWLCRNAVGDMDEQDLTPFLIDKIRKTKDNEAFLRSINTDVQSSAPAY